MGYEYIFLYRALYGCNLYYLPHIMHLGGGLLYLNPRLENKHFETVLVVFHLPQSGDTI
jgi:hypothetical protein